jgi:Cellulose synthase subunit D
VSEPMNGMQASHERHAASPTVAWRTFLRGLAVELDAQVGADASMAILRAIGQQMAEQLRLITVSSLDALALEMNMILGEIGWGSVQLTLLEAERCVIMTHIGLPQLGSTGEPPGTWLAPVLEGLYQGWMAQQPGADGSLVARLGVRESGRIVIRYSR